MSLLLVVVLLFFSSSCSVSSGQYYVSDDCSSVTQSPCNPLSVYAGNMSQYNNTIFYFIGTSVINFTVTMDSVQNITLHGLDQSPTIHCLNFNAFIAVTTSSHVSFSNITFHCPIYLRYSSNITIAGSIFKMRHWYMLVSLYNVFDNIYINYYLPPVCYNELHHYSLTLTNVTMTNRYLEFYMDHGTSYNVSVVIDNVNIQFENCHIKGVESQSTISCSISDSDEYGLAIGGALLPSAQISVIDTELVGNWRNEIAWCLSIILNNITVTNSLSTGLVITNSVVTVENRLVFKNNTGVVGGGMAINGSSVVALLPSANLEFIDNHATYKGGGIYLDKRTGYTFFGLSPIPITLQDNTAGVAGKDIYGIDYGLEHSFASASANISTSSDASAFGLCDPDSNQATPIFDGEQQSVFPGQTLKYNVALFGRTFKTSSYSLTDGRITIKINGTLVIDKYINNCSLIEYTPKYINYGRLNITLIVTTDTLYSKELSIPFILNECPIGFSVNSSGLCDCSVSRENVTCDINTLHITHNGLLWIGTYHTSTLFNDNEINPNACIINEDCLLYCSPNPVTFQFNHTDTQCVDNRGHRMCGSCTEGHSLLMGSNKCGHCHNNYMMIGWIALFAVMGVLLVVLLIALNLTVSMGTLNGLLFYANIVKLYEPVFSRKGALPVLSQVISWINLDFGFEICFYNGMDSYAKQWLQFAFPLYLWIIIIIIIQLCKRYGKISRLMGSHAVPVLSTLFLLSYTKLVRTIVIVLHKRELSHMKCYDALIKKLLKKQDKDDDDQDLTKSHKTVDQQMKEIVPTSTDVRLRDNQCSVYSLIQCVDTIGNGVLRVYDMEDRCFDSDLKIMNSRRGKIVHVSCLLLVDYNVWVGSLNKTIHILDVETLCQDEPRDLALSKSEPMIVWSLLLNGTVLGFDPETRERVAKSLTCYNIHSVPASLSTGTSFGTVGTNRGTISILSTEYSEQQLRNEIAFTESGKTVEVKYLAVSSEDERFFMDKTFANFKDF
uniref:Right handed beta helix domain-containing protein n=1 Tax=Amphimedon queenslandica TaxID=400682 RepID=A0A1X7U7P7_AMPQE